MVAKVFTVAIAALFCSSMTFAAPVVDSDPLQASVAEPTDAGNSTVTPVSDAINPFSGVSFTPYKNHACSKDDQGNTNVNLGTTACPNVSNAGSYQIFADLCKEAELHYYTGFDCKGKLVKVQTKGAGCYSRRGNYKSIRVKPTNCQF